METTIKKQLNHLNIRKIVDSLESSGIVWLWKTGLGNILNDFPRFFGHHLIVTLSSDGKKIPLYYFVQEDEIYALVGQDEIAECRENLLKNPSLEVWMRSGWFSCCGEILSERNKIEILQTINAEDVFGLIVAAKHSGPLEMSEVMKIKRTAACTGSNGPGSYAWVWSTAALFFFVSWIFKKKK